MRANKRRDTGPELTMRRRLRRAGLTGYRLQWKVAGHPDIAWPGAKVALFVNGCYWHRCPHCNLPLPKRNREFWQRKFDANRARDARNIEELELEGWRVHVVWECELKPKTIDETCARLLPVLASELSKELKAGSLGAADDPS